MNLSEKHDSILQIIRSNKLFVEILRKVLPDGEQLPTKIGKKGQIPALAKTDDGFNYLLNHPVENVHDLAGARLASKSWINHFLRIESMEDQAKSRNGNISVGIRYYGAHTGRWSGSEGINLQNLPGAGRVGSGTHPLLQKIRGLLIAPPDYILPIVDLSQIEARVLAWFAGQDDLVKDFAEGKDIYSQFATELFGHLVRKDKKSDPPPVAKRFKIQRGFGKDAILGCLAVGTPILTDKGWKSIENVWIDDKLWDGKQWINHKGIFYKGKKRCIKVNGVWMTPEHEILHLGEWITAQELNTINQKLEINSDNLQLQRLHLETAVGLSPSNVVAPVVEYLLQHEIIWSKENLHVVMSVLKNHPAKLRVIARGLKNHISLGFLTEFVLSLAGVKQDHIKNMVKEALEYGLNGSQIEYLFLNIWQRYQDGIIQNLTSTELIMIKDMNLEISDSLQESKILETVDILYSGDYKRFQAGNLIVSNCGYGMGASKFYDRCYANSDLKPLFDSGVYNAAFIEQLIKHYRHKYTKITKHWQDVEKAFRWVIKYPSQHQWLIFNGKEFEWTTDITTGDYAGTNKCILHFYNVNNTVYIQLPSSRCLRYPHSRITGDGKISWKWGKLWGGSIVENIVQAASRDIMAEAILKIESAKIPIVLHLHDEIVGCVPKEFPNDAGQSLQFMIDTMCNNPPWAIGLPINAEGELSEKYKK